MSDDEGHVEPTRETPKPAPQELPPNTTKEDSPDKTDVDDVDGFDRYAKDRLLRRGLAEKKAEEGRQVRTLPGHERLEDISLQDALTQVDHTSEKLSETKSRLALLCCCGFRKPTFSNGYEYPKPPFKRQMVSFGGWMLTPVGVLAMTWCISVVAFGAMLTFVMFGWTSANLDRTAWTEIDSQVLNGLFSIAAFAPAPWRFRNTYYLMRARCCRDKKSLRRLASIFRAWFRLAGHETLSTRYCPKRLEARASTSKWSWLPWTTNTEDDSNLDQSEAPDAAKMPFPIYRLPDCPLTSQGESQTGRAPGTALWKVDFVVMMELANTLLQAVLCYYMWGMGPSQRPAWSTPTLVATGCGSASAAGLMGWWESGRVQVYEGKRWPRAKGQYALVDNDLSPADCTCYRNDGVGIEKA